jgi:hypothetical protein
MCDGLCEAGYYCPRASTSIREFPCAPGRYGHAGMVDEFCKGKCMKGYYCPIASTSPWEYECTGDYVYCPAGVGAPIVVDSNHYSVGQNDTIRVDQNECDRGDYYGTPPAGNVRTNICPRTTQGP